MLRQFGEQPITKGEHSRCAPRPIDIRNRLLGVGLGPDREAALVSRLVQREILCHVRRSKHFHLVQMQVVVARQLNPHKSGRLICKQDGQRLTVAEAIERPTVMLIDSRPSTRIVGDFDQQAGGAVGAVAAVPDDHPRDRLGFAQIDLPPRLVLLLRMESWSAILHSIATAGRIITWQERHLIGGSQALFIIQPVSLDQPPPGRRAGG